MNTSWNRSMTIIALLLGVAYAAMGVERWPGVKVTYYKGANFDQELMTCYERELRFDGWVPLPNAADKRREPFSVRWEADLHVTCRGEYSLRVERPSWAKVDLQLGGRPVVWTSFEEEYERRGKTRVRKLPISEPVALEPGHVAVRLEIRFSEGRYNARGGYDLLWRGPFAEKPVSAAVVSVKPWPDMRRRPLLRFAMVGHSNVEGRAGKAIPPIAHTAWSYDSSARMWRPLTKSWSNHTMAMTTLLSQKYPDRFFGGMMLGKAASNVCDQWREGQALYLDRLRILRNTVHCGPLLAMGCHFDWDEMKKQKFVDAFERDNIDLIRRFRRDLGLPDLPWIFTRLSPCFSAWGPGSGRQWDPGPGRGSRWYQVVYEDADQIAAAVPPCRVVTTDDFVRPDDCGPEGDMHYTHQGFRKWAERALPLLRDMLAIEKAIARLDAPAEPYPKTVELAKPWPVSGDPDQLIISMEGTVTRVTRARAPKELGPYPNALMTVEYKPIHIFGAGHRYEPERIIFAMPSVADRKSTAATRFKPGMKHVVVACSYEAQPTTIQQLPLDDDIQELELPIYFAAAVYDQYPPRNRGTWIYTFLRRYAEGNKGSVIPDLKRILGKDKRN